MVIGAIATLGKVGFLVKGSTESLSAQDDTVTVIVAQDIVSMTGMNLLSRSTDNSSTVSVVSTTALSLVLDASSLNY